jgi:restriction system protein
MISSDTWEGSMARKSKRTNARTARRREGAAVKLIGLGIALLVIPFALRNSPIGQGLASLWPVGTVMLLAGGVLMWLTHRKPKDSAIASTTPSAAKHVQAPTLQPHDDAGPVDRTATELERLIEPQKLADAKPTSRPDAWGTAVFDVIEWRRFEAVVELLFQQAGFETKSQSHGADGGVDVWLYSRNKPGSSVSLVQCKHWQGKRVGVNKVRELRGVMAAQNVTRGQFATTSTFTPDAETFARENGVNLLDVNRLLTLIAKRTPEQQQALLDAALEGEYWRPTCVNCGTKMLDRTPRKGGAPFWGCANYPKCKTTMPMRTS